MAVIVLIASIAFFAAYVVDFGTVPYEDAAILMRYAQHFADGHGIVWNVGETPVDGATDFLYMIVVGLLVKAGLSLEHSSRSVGIVSHVLLVLVVYQTLRARLNASPLVGLLSSLYLATGPGLFLAAAYFGTPLFALFAAVTWSLALSLIQEQPTHARAFWFAASSLTLGLIRPEGVILSGLMLVSVLYLQPKGLRSRTLWHYLGVFSLAGGAYFLWRWHYFGYPLPNPFYKKGGGHLYPDSLRASLRNVVALGLPFLPAFIFGFYSRHTSRRAVAFLIPIAGFALSFVLLSDEMNFGRRFQYALLPIIALSWWPLLQGIRADVTLPSWEHLDRRKRATLLVGASAIAVALAAYQSTITRPGSARDGRYDVAIALRRYSGRSFTIAASEAGLLPLYSTWRAIDTWGLNDQWIAHTGTITPEYLERSRPEVIMFHSFPLVAAPWRGSNWGSMVATLKKYAEENGYVLAAAYGLQPEDVFYYYVRSDFPESRDIIESIRGVDYYYLGGKAVNYASSVCFLAR